MASKLTKQINSKFNPTSLSGYSVYALGGYPQMYGLGSFIKDKALPFVGDMAKLYADNTLSTFGASDVIKDNSYKNKIFKDISGVTSKIYGAAGQIGANILAPGIGGAVMGGIQQGVGSIAGDQSKMMNEQQQQQQNALNEEIKRQSTTNLPAQQNYVPTFADGGNLPTANTFINALRNVKTYFSGEPDKNLVESQYKPTISKDKDVKYYIRPGMREDVFKDLTSEEVKKMYNHSGEFSDIYKALINNGKDRPNKADEAFPKNKAGYHGMYNRGHGSFKGEFNLGRYRVDAGKDEKGKYISFSDVYDWNGVQNLGKMPINFYDRIYEDDWNNLKNKDTYTETKIYPMFANGGELSYLPSITNFTTPINTDLTIEKNPMFLDRSRFRKMGPSFRVEANKLDSYIDNIAGQLNNYNFPEKEKDGMRYRQTEFRRLKEDLYNYQQNPDTKKFEFADGGSIHIKPENKGKFTAAAKSRGMGVQEFASKILANKENYSSTLVKRANFARNATKFKHEMGGLLDSYAGGGNMNTFGTNLDNTTVYANGGTHESNPYSGIQIGNNSLVEEDEVRFGDYIFSNRIPFKKK